MGNSHGYGTHDGEDIQRVRARLSGMRARRRLKDVPETKRRELLRLAGSPSWSWPAGAAAIIALRQLLGLGLWTSTRTGAALVERLLRPAWRLRHRPLRD